MSETGGPSRMASGARDSRGGHLLADGPGRMVGLFGWRNPGEGHRRPRARLPLRPGSPPQTRLWRWAPAVEAMVAAGAKVRKPPQRPQFFDGYPAYVEALDGTVWELVYNPGFHFDSEGTPHFAPPGAREAAGSSMRQNSHPLQLAAADDRACAEQVPELDGRRRRRRRATRRKRWFRAGLIV
jgi:hypothetical protein